MRSAAARRFGIARNLQHVRGVGAARIRGRLAGQRFPHNKLANSTLNLIDGLPITLTGALEDGRSCRTSVNSSSFTARKASQPPSPMPRSSPAIPTARRCNLSPTGWVATSRSLLPPSSSGRSAAPSTCGLPYFLCEPRPIAQEKPRIPWRYRFWNTMSCIYWSCIATMLGSILPIIADSIAKHGHAPGRGAAVPTTPTLRTEASTARLETRQSLGWEHAQHAFPAATNWDIPPRNHHNRHR